jgi:L-alanine-DL-glutamate epimerase-like enolase superfamily enzyme
MTEMFPRFHIHGRTGPVLYALSAIEIALWDIAGKLASLPIASLLGGAPRELTAYASLLRCAEPELVAAAVDRALAQGFRHPGRDDAHACRSQSRRDLGVRVNVVGKAVQQHNRRPTRVASLKVRDLQIASVDV